MSVYLEADGLFVAIFLPPALQRPYVPMDELKTLEDSDDDNDAANIMDDFDSDEEP